MTSRVGGRQAIRWPPRDRPGRSGQSMSVIAAREMLKRIVEWGTSRDDIRGVVLLGSQARRERPADEWSDIDLAVFADGPDRYLTSSDWLAPLGRVLVTTVESSA